MEAQVESKSSAGSTISFSSTSTVRPLDMLTDALVLVGQHGVYCQSARQPGKPAMDIQMIAKALGDAKELVIGAMDELKRPQTD